MECNEYTLQNQCSKCKNITIGAHPAKFSIDDKYIQYRVKNKKLE